MTAAEQRAALAEVGRALVANRGEPGQRRAAALLTRPNPHPAADFATLLAVPDWLCWPADRQAALANATALRVSAPALAVSIDGRWLGSLAKVAGEEMLDWAIVRGASADPADSDGPRLQARDLTATGFGTLAAALPPGLRGYLTDAGAGEPLSATDADIADAAAFVGAREA